MQMVFEVVVDIEGVSPEMVAEAIRDRIRSLYLCDGDTVYVDFPSVTLVGWGGVDVLEG